MSVYDCMYYFTACDGENEKLCKRNITVYIINLKGYISPLVLEICCMIYYGSIWKSLHIDNVNFSILVVILIF